MVTSWLLGRTSDSRLILGGQAHGKIVHGALRCMPAGRRAHRGAPSGLPLVALERPLLGPSVSETPAVPQAEQITDLPERARMQGDHEAGGGAQISIRGTDEEVAHQIREIR